MDNLDWSNEVEESLIMSSSNGVPYNSNKIETTPKDIYNPAQQIQKPDLFSNVFPQWNSRSGAGSGWGVAINAGTSRSSIEYTRPLTLNSNPQNGLILDSGISSLESNSSGLIEQLNPGISTNTGSFESLDCLLSASPSLTDTTTSLEDDGISLIFSDCKSVWNFASMKSVPSLASSSSDITKPGKIIETVSHTSEEIINRSRSSRFADDDFHQPNANKRKRVETDQPNIGLIMEQNIDFLRSNYSAATDRGSCSFQLVSENHQKPKKPRLDKHPISSSNINFQQPSSSASSADEPDAEAIAQMKEIIYRAAAFRPVNFGVEAVEKPKRKNVRISNDPQTVAARQRRERISERIRVLQKLVPGGSKMDTASMLDEAANYLKFLRSQVKALEALGPKIDPTVNSFPINAANLAFSPFVNYSFSMQQPQFSIRNPNPVDQSKS